MSTIKFAQQGIRQNAIPGGDLNKILKPGEIILVSIGYMEWDRQVIQEGTIGILHSDGDDDITISVIRDDCKAARKAIRLSEINK